jgi:UDP-N-acetylmuramate--alanine ligase
MEQSFQNLFFLGIGGIGMSGIALCFHQRGYKVVGYDRTETPLTQSLVNKGITVFYDENIHLIPAEFSPENTLIVLTPAVPKEQAQRLYFEQHGFKIKKRAEVLGTLTNDLFQIAVAGTHGKTTTSSMIAHILKECQKDPTAFLGGITANYETNFLLSENSSGDKNTYSVVEADEFDRSFLHLRPEIAVITSSDADHLDIYGEAEELEKTYGKFAALVKKILFVHQEVPQNLLVETQKNCRVIFYGIEKVQDMSNVNQEKVQAFNTRVEGRKFIFDLNYLGTIYRNFELLVPGWHNVCNATAALATALSLGINVDELRTALKKFRGVKRRFEFIFDQNKTTYIDDYAHHPSEINAFLTSVRTLYPERKITAIFQPHLFSRTRDFLEGFAEALSAADEVLLMEIYPARERPIEGITSEFLFSKIKNPNKTLVNFDNIEKILHTKEIDVLVTIGAGDIDKLVPRLKIFCENIWK